MNDCHAVIVGICETTRTFRSNAVVYTTYSRAKYFAPQERKILSYILAKSEPGQDQHEVALRIAVRTGLKAKTTEELKWMTMMYYLKYTRIPINVGITSLLGFLVGTTTPEFGITGARRSSRIQSFRSGRNIRRISMCGNSRDGC